MVLIYIGTESVEINLARIAKRVLWLRPVPVLFA